MNYPFSHCIICGYSKFTATEIDYGTEIYCHSCGQYSVDDDVAALYDANEWPMYRNYMNYTLLHKIDSRLNHFVSSDPTKKSFEWPDVMIVHDLSKLTYTGTHTHLQEKTLYNIFVKSPQRGRWIDITSFINSDFFDDSDSNNGPVSFEDGINLLGFLIEDKLVEIKNQQLRLTNAGFNKLMKFIENKPELSTAFIAMKFKDNDALYQALKRAIEKSGYLPLRIDYAEHNNEIMPEIFARISQSRFLVADISDDNLGVYYEAGFALGKGKEVIITLNESLKPRVHFDLNHRNQIRYSNFDQLITKLHRRIMLTIGPGPNKYEPIE